MGERDKNLAFCADAQVVERIETYTFNMENCYIKGDQPSIEEAHLGKQELNLVALSLETPFRSVKDKQCDLRVASEVTGNLQKSLEEFASANRLTIVRDSRGSSYRMQIGSEQVEIFRTEASAKGIEKASSLLEEKIRKEMGELTARYGIVFAKENEPVGYQRATSESAFSNHLVRARKPQIHELYALSSALELSETSGKGPDNGPLKIVFLQERMITGINPYATYENDETGKASLLIWPEASSLPYLTEADIPSNIEDSSSYNRNITPSFQRILVHELTHNTSVILGYDKKLPGQPVSELTESGVVMAKELGWVRRQDVEGSGEDWLLEGRSIDDNGIPATYLADHGPFSTSWVRWRKEGGAVDEFGKVVPAHKAERLSEAEMLDEARVKPASWYFYNPEEMYAEAMTFFRLSSNSRRGLKNRSPELYRIVKRDDQRDIDAFFGKGDQGSSTMIRLPSGKIVENNRFNHLVLERFEQNRY